MTHKESVEIVLMYVVENEKPFNIKIAGHCNYGIKRKHFQNELEYLEFLKQKLFDAIDFINQNINQCFLDFDCDLTDEDWCNEEDEA